MLTLWRISRLL